MKKSVHIKADYHLKLKPGSNVATINALSHVIVAEGLVDEEFVKERCEIESFNLWKDFVALERNSPEALEVHTGIPANIVRGSTIINLTVQFIMA